ANVLRPLELDPVSGRVEITCSRVIPIPTIQYPRVGVTFGRIRQVENPVASTGKAKLAHSNVHMVSPGSAVLYCQHGVSDTSPVSYRQIHPNIVTVGSHPLSGGNLHRNPNQLGREAHVPTNSVVSGRQPGNPRSERFRGTNLCNRGSSPPLSVPHCQPSKIGPPNQLAIRDMVRVVCRIDDNLVPVDVRSNVFDALNFGRVSNNRNIVFAI